MLFSVFCVFSLRSWIARVKKCDAIEKTFKPLDESITRFKNIDFEGWSDNRNDTIGKLKEISQLLKKVNNDTGIGQTTGGAGQIAGGVLGIVGVLTLNPALVLSGFGLTVGGGVTSTVSSIIKYGWNRSQDDELKKLLKQDSQLTKEICDAFCHLRDQVTKISQNKQLWNDIKAGGKGFNAYVEVLKAGSEIANKAAIVRLIAEYAPEAPMLRRQLTGAILADGKFFGKAIFTAGSVAAKSLKCVFTGVDVVFGVLDVIEGTKHITNGSNLAKKIDDIRKQLENERETLTKQYNNIQQFLVEY